MNVSKIEELKEKIKDFKQSHDYPTVVLKFTNRYEQPYEIQCYVSPDKEYYLRASQAQSCIVTPDIQGWMQSKSKAHQEKRKAEGASVGSTVHRLVEWHFLGFTVDESVALKVLTEECQKNFILHTSELLFQVHNAYQSFLMLKEKTGLQFIASEVMVYSDQLGCAGKIDMIGMIDGTLRNIDFKSGSVSNGVKTEASQSFYKFAFEECLGIPILNTIFHLKREPKPDGTPDGYHYTYNHYDMSLRAFIGSLSVFQVHEWKNLKTFWPKWNDDLSTVRHREWK